jgi:hypothetical protein
MDKMLKELAGSYVQKVGEDTRRYTQELLLENERLRALVTTLRSEHGRLEARLGSVDALSAEANKTRDLLVDSESEKRRLREQLVRVTGELERHLEDQRHLRTQLEEVETQNRRYMAEFTQVEQQNNNLTNLYVASYRLHGTLDRNDVVGTIQEIIANLVGSEEHAIYELKPGTNALSLVACIGIDSERYRQIPVGQGPIGRVASTGEPFVVGEQGASPDPEEPELTACIPLKLNNEVSGVIALFRLLPQKPCFEPVDHELFDLLATHAATALYTTGLHAQTGSRG